MILNCYLILSIFLIPILIVIILFMISLPIIFLITELGKSFKACVISGRYERTHVCLTVRNDTRNISSIFSERILIGLDTFATSAIYLPYILNYLRWNYLTL